MHHDLRVITTWVRNKTGKPLLLTPNIKADKRSKKQIIFKYLKVPDFFPDNIISNHYTSITVHFFVG